MNQDKKENKKVNNTSQVSDLFNNAKNIAICTAEDNKYLNSGVALSMYIKEHFKKDAYVVYLGDLENVDPVYADYAEIRPYFAGKKVKITLDYRDTNVESLSWERTGDDRLIMEMGPVNRNFEQNRLKYETVGHDVDLIVMIGFQSLDSVGKFYTSNKLEFDNSQIINIDINEKNQRFGDINIVDPKSESIISLMLRKFVEWNYTPTSQVSSVLLYGLQKTSDENGASQPIEFSLKKSEDSQL